MTWVDYATLGGLVLALWGLRLNYRQLSTAQDQMAKTASAADAARAAMQETEKRLAANQALLLLPQLRMLESQLEGAVKNERSAEAQTTLIQWRDVGSQLTSFLLRRENTDKHLLETLEKSIDLASKAKGVLFEQDVREGDDLKSLIDVTRATLSAMGQVCVLIAKLTEHFITEASGGGDVA